MKKLLGRKTSLLVGLLVLLALVGALSFTYITGSHTPAKASAGEGSRCYPDGGTPIPNCNDAQVTTSSDRPVTLDVGQAFTMTITITNTGTTTWTPQGGYALGSQAPRNNVNWGTNRIALPQQVAPGDRVTFTLNLTAPATAGCYRLEWRMVQSGVEWFGSLYGASGEGRVNSISVGNAVCNG